jgi:hypothetical protein
MIVPSDSKTITITPRMITSGSTNFHHVENGTRPIIRPPATTAKVGVNRFSV